MIATNSRSFDCLSILISVSNTRFCSHFNVLPVVWERLSRLVLVLADFESSSKFAFRFFSRFFFHFYLSCVEATISVRLNLMRIRFRGTDFGQVAKTNLVSANQNRLLV